MAVKAVGPTEAISNTNFPVMCPFNVWQLEIFRKNTNLKEHKEYRQNLIQKNFLVSYHWVHQTFKIKEN